MEIVNVSEYEAVAKQKLPKMVFDYYASGAEDQWTLKENRNAFERIRFRPRVLVDVSKIDTSTTVLGFKISMPIMIAPTAMQKMAHPDGELATARAASAAGTIMTLSSWSTSSVEEVSSTGPGIRFFQLYVLKDRHVVAQLVRRAENAGFRAIVLTVDTPRLGRREADIRNRFILPSHLTLKNFEGLDLGTKKKTEDSGLASYVANQIDRSLSWKDVKWLQTITHLPILVKGVITAEDTRLAVQASVAGIIVSNHGARQLDYVPATINCLEEVVKAAQGQVPVFLDGGVRRGTDVFKALALGASGVFIGRPVVFALAAEGEAGVRKVLQMLHDEFELAMSLAGCCSVKDINHNYIQTEADMFRALSSSGQKRPEPAGLAEMRTNSPKKVGHLGREDANRKNLSRSTGTFGTNGHELAGSAKISTRSTVPNGTKGRVGRGSPKEPKANHAAPRVIGRMRDKEAHFGRIGGLCPKRFGTSGTKRREGRERAGRSTNQIMTRVTREKVKKSKGEFSSTKREPKSRQG
ncbi:hypothetical protein KI387_031855 [Taxus chinensis]|uniref:(S)-2-hydroxy-acid oxidase n=1 Tax=Taxus chinensis TaxID=29808 RepID=A0AA38F307_TAXCH|nr:hypothetical protein KI387_031855 [Taxus chinensis]